MGKSSRKWGGLSFLGLTRILMEQSSLQQGTNHQFISSRKCRTPPKWAKWIAKQLITKWTCRVVYILWCGLFWYATLLKTFFKSSSRDKRSFTESFVNLVNFLHLLTDRRDLTFAKKGQEYGHNIEKCQQTVMFWPKVGKCTANYQSSTGRGVQLMLEKVLSEYKKVKNRENLSKVELYQAKENWQLRFVPAIGIISAWIYI